MLQSSFLPRTPSTFHQGRHRVFRRSVLLGFAAIFGLEKKNCLQDSPRASCPCGEEDEREEPTSQLHICREGKVVEKIRDILEKEVHVSVGTTRFGGVVFVEAALTLAAAFLDFPAVRLRATVDLGSCLFGPNVSLVAVTLSCSGTTVAC